MSDRDLADLQPPVEAAAKKALAAADAAGLKYVITCTYRTKEEQAALYAQGRTAPGPRVTDAKPGQSFHEYRVAIDIYIIVNGKIDWSGTAPQWKVLAKCFKDQGFEWAGEWKTFKELPHFQMTGGHPLSYFQNGGKL